MLPFITVKHKVTAYIFFIIFSGKNLEWMNCLIVFKIKSNSYITVVWFAGKNNIVFCNQRRTWFFNTVNQGVQFKILIVHLFCRKCKKRYRNEKKINENMLFHSNIIDIQKLMFNDILNCSKIALFKVLLSTFSYFYIKKRRFFSVKVV